MRKELDPLRADRLVCRELPAGGNVMSVQDLEGCSPNNYYYVRDQLQRHVYDRSNEAFAAGDAARDALRSPKDIEKRQAEIRARFIEGLGGLPPSDTPLDPVITGTIPCDGFRIEKVIFQSRPKTFVTANLYVPDGITSPRGAVLFLCGHHEQAKHQPEYQIVCRHLAQVGLVVLAQDPVGQGERFSYFDKQSGKQTVSWGTIEHDYAGTQCLAVGDAIARYFVHDAMRGIDYLMTRSEVDPARIGVTGNSGGGTQTCLMMVCDPRIAAAAPGTFIMNRQTYMYAGGAQDAEQIWPRMTALGFDHEDILLMMAPKPVRVLAVTYDFFPIEGTRRSVERARRLWEVLGKPGLLDLVEDETDHWFTPKLARAAAEFFSLHLLGGKRTPDSECIEALEPRDLWCTKSGQVRGEIEGARFVFEENLDRLRETETARESIPDSERRKQASEWLRSRVFRDRRPCAQNPRRYSSAVADDLDAQMWLWWSQEGVLNHGFVFRSTEADAPVTIAVWDGGTTSLAAHAEWIRKTCEAGRAVLVLDTSGVGQLVPNTLNNCPIHGFYGVIHKLNDDLIWLDDCLAALRTYDVIRALDAIEALPSLRADDIRVYAHGRQGVYAQLAAFLDDRVKSIEVVEGMGSFAAWVGSREYDAHDIRSIVFPGILRYLDLHDPDRWVKTT